jgi:hypothetical protein
MTRDEIISMAREAQLAYGSDEFLLPSVELFFKAAYEAGANAEREECAKVAEQMLRHYTQAVTGVSEAIRARGKA